MSATLQGGQVKDFLDAMDAGNEAAALKVLADAYDTLGNDLAEKIDFDQSHWGAISYNDYDG